MNKVPVPFALQKLIELNEQHLRNIKAELEAEIYKANAEIMNLLNLDKNDGWKLDVEHMCYVRDEPTE